MRYKQYIVAASFALLLAACGQDETLPAGNKGELRLAPAVENMTQVSVRSAGNAFFKEGDEIGITVKSSTDTGTGKAFTYTYKNSVFAGNPGYFFSLDDSYITELTASWPKDGAESEIETDQRTLENYRKADKMTATTTLEGIMPTDAPVPLTFKHNNCRLVFELAGQNANGLKIESLILELQYNGKPAAFWAYCGEGGANWDGNAALILDPAISIDSEEQYMIGRITVAGSKEYTGTIFFPATDVKLQAGYSYLVTLTPRGDNLIASIHFGGWGQDEEGIGVPFQLPAKVASNPDLYVISNAAQLVTLSYLIRNYPSPDGTNANGTDWTKQNYTITNEINMAGIDWKSIPSAKLPSASIGGQENIKKLTGPLFQ